jgi:hypothetical protein
MICKSRRVGPPGDRQTVNRKEEEDEEGKAASCKYQRQHGKQTSEQFVLLLLWHRDPLKLLLRSHMVGGVAGYGAKGGVTK